MCDARRGVYFDISQIYSVQSILRVNEDGSQPTPIPFPTGLDSKGQWSFSPDTSGSVYLLLTNVDDPLLIHMSSSGEEVSRMKLSLPKSFHVHSFAVQSDGRSLFFGSFMTIKTESESGSGVHRSPEIVDVPFLFWLDAAGRLNRKEPFGKMFSRSTTEPDGLIVAGMPGIFYVATSAEVREYSSRGDFFKKFLIAPPSKNSHLSSLQFVDRWIALLFTYPATTTSVETGISNKAESPSSSYYGPLKETWLLASTVSGEAEGYYNAPEDIKGSALCYVGQHSFLYITVRDRQLFLVEAEQ